MIEEFRVSECRFQNGVLHQWIMWCSVLHFGASKCGHTNTHITTRHSIQNFVLSPMAMICKIDSGATKCVQCTHITPRPRHYVHIAAVATTTSCVITKLPVYKFILSGPWQPYEHGLTQIQNFQLKSDLFSFLFYFEKKRASMRAFIALNRVILIEMNNVANRIVK